MRLTLLQNVMKSAGIPLAGRFRRLSIELLEGRAMPAALVDMPIAGGVRDANAGLPIVADERLADRLAARRSSQRVSDSVRIRHLRSVAVALALESDEFLDELKRIA